MSVRLRIDGYAIVSADGMIADPAGDIPPGLVNPADQRFFADALEHADLIVHGRRSHEGHPQSAQRRRLVLTRSVTTLSPHPGYPKAMLWNPDGAPLEAAGAALGVERGIVAIIGGTEAYGHFLPYYHTFYLCRAAHVRIPGGRPVFPGIPPLTPEHRLAEHGLAGGEQRMLDAAAGISVQSWRRPTSDA